jgi:hypothetical protein
LVGDKESDIQAATAAGIAGYRYQGGNLCDFIKRLLPTNSADDKVTFWCGITLANGPSFRDFHYLVNSWPEIISRELRFRQGSACFATLEIKMLGSLEFAIAVLRDAVIKTILQTCDERAQPGMRALPFDVKPAKLF